MRPGGESQMGEQERAPGIFNRIVGVALILFGLISFALVSYYGFGAVFFGASAILFGIFRLMAGKEPDEDKKLERIFRDLDSWQKIVILYCGGRANIFDKVVLTQCPHGALVRHYGRPSREVTWARRFGSMVAEGGKHDT
jgi:hypothetical protein